VIRLVLLADYEEDTVSLLLKRLTNAYGVGAEVGRRTEIPSDAYDPAADAYEAVKVVADAPDVRAFGDDKILFVTDRPLSLPVGPLGKGPVDGFAQYGGLKAVVTSAGLGAPGRLPLPEGIAKRSAQQVGHLFGLHHCHDARCAMLPGWAEGFEKNPDTVLCPFCREKSEKRIMGT